jgi:2-haloacid dehalogenase
VLTFDVGGTVLDWHRGLVAALAGHQPGRDWHGFVNEYRRRSLQRMIGAVNPDFDIDDVHREVLGELMEEKGIAGFSAGDRQTVATAWHGLPAWPDFPPALARLRQRYPCVAFTILSLPLVIDVSRANGIAWDAVIACAMLQVYKTRPEAYQRAAALLDLAPSEILMVACHNFDLDAARREGFRTAFVRRPEEWGAAGPPDPVPNPASDLVIDDFGALADRLCT